MQFEVCSYRFPQHLRYPVASPRMILRGTVASETHEMLGDCWCVLCMTQTYGRLMFSILTKWLHSMDQLLCT
jgi:hypothetical protein